MFVRTILWIFDTLSTHLICPLLNTSHHLPDSLWILARDYRLCYSGYGTMALQEIGRYWTVPDGFWTTQPSIGVMNVRPGCT